MPEFDVHLRCTRIFGWDAEEYSRHQLCTMLTSRSGLAAAACITHIEAASRGMAFTAISRAPILVCFLQASRGTFVSPMCLVISAIYCRWFAVPWLAARNITHSSSFVGPLSFSVSKNTTPFGMGPLPRQGCWLVIADAFLICICVGGI